MPEHSRRPPAREIRPAGHLRCAATLTLGLALGLALTLGACSRSALDTPSAQNPGSAQDPGAPGHNSDRGQIREVVDQPAMTIAGSPAPVPLDDMPAIGDPLPIMEPPAPIDRAPACRPGTGAFIYVISDGRRMYRFDPTSNTLSAIGELDCAQPNESAFSMAVDRSGNAYVLLASTETPDHGNLVRASTRDASCERIAAYVPNQFGFGLFGMAFTIDNVPGGESLYVSGAGHTGSTTGLARLDTTTFALTPIGDNDPPLNAVELAGSPEGSLYAFFTFDGAWTTWHVGEFDLERGNLLWDQPFTELPSSPGTFALSYWNGSFYAFTGFRSGPDADKTTVTRFDPKSNVSEGVAALEGVHVVGVGTSTCRP